MQVQKTLLPGMHPTTPFYRIDQQGDAEIKLPKLVKVTKMITLLGTAVVKGKVHKQTLT